MLPEKINTKMRWISVAVTGGKYQVSDTGLVRNSRTLHVLQPAQSGPRAKRGQGYWAVGVTVDGRAVTLKVHRLVAMAFVPNPHNAPTVNHKNGNKADNHATNLEWLSIRDNVRHAIATGLRARVPFSGCKSVKLSDEKARDIRRHLSDGHLSQREIAHFYDVTPMAISKIANGQIYKQ